MVGLGRGRSGAVWGRRPGDVAVDVGDDERGADVGEVHGLELQERTGAVRVREEGLVHREPDLLARRGLARDEMGVGELAGESEPQGKRSARGTKGRRPGPL